MPGPNGELLTNDALRAIHWAHRLGAIVTVLVVGGFALVMLRVESGTKVARMLLALLLLQVILGVSNVWLGLPLPVAVAHNGVAALLLISLVVLNFRLNFKRT